MALWHIGVMLLAPYFWTNQHCIGEEFGKLLDAFIFPENYLIRLE